MHNTDLSILKINDTHRYPESHLRGTMIVVGT
jgi:hypothetical protein